MFSCGSANPPLQPPPTSAVAPPSSAGHALVYHSALRAVVLVNAGLGGMSSPSSSSRTVLWRWDGRSWSVLDSSGPPVRNLGGVAYDSHRDRIVLHGGSYSQDLVYDETWEWSPSSGWTRRDVAGPGRRDHTDMVYDAERRRVVLFGGQTTPGAIASGTWTWDGNAWQEVSASSPAGRVHHTMVYDAVGRRTLLFGGIASGSALGDTWAWTGTAWEQAAAPTTPRSHARMTMTADGVILLGGFPAEAGSVARLVGATWSTLPTSGGPGARYLTALVYDPDRQVTVLFGGGDPSSDRLYDDTWEYSAASGWRSVAP
jgi:hypothetical protein